MPANLSQSTAARPAARAAPCGPAERDVPPRPLSSLLGVALAAALVLLPGRASAHAILLSSTPPAGSTVAAGPVTFTFRFNSRVDRARSLLRLTRPDKSQVALPIGEGGPPDTLETRTDLAPGTYTIRWQVLAVDGHVTRGDVVFVVAPKP